MKTISIHASMTPSSEDIGRLELEKQHRAFGYFQIGYHYVIRRNGKTESGRPENSRVPHSDPDEILVCVVGGVSQDGAPSDNFTNAQKTELIVFLDQLQKRERGDIRIVSKTPAVSQPLIDSLFKTT